jgi:hypothetical protein
MRRIRALAFAALVATGATACADDDPEPSPPALASSTTAGATPEATARNEAAVILDALHEARTDDCTTPNWETNITLPPERGIPLPVTRGTCRWDDNQVTVVALAAVDDRTTYIAAWNRRLCAQSNAEGRRLLGGTNWVVNPHTVTLVPSPDVGARVVEIAGGELQRADCPEN